MSTAVPLSTLRPGVVRVVPLSPDDQGRPREALVVLDERGAPRAYLNRCMHIPVPLDGGSRDFLTEDGRLLRCGTHGAVYRRSDGRCVAGPCRGQSLVPLPLRVGASGELVVDEPSA